MAGKKIGKLSKSMIIRRKPRETVGAAGDNKQAVASSDAGVTDLRGPADASPETAGTLVIPRHSGAPAGSAWGSSKVVPLHPRSIRERSDDSEDDDLDVDSRFIELSQNPVKTRVSSVDGNDQSFLQPQTGCVF